MQILLIMAIVAVSILLILIVLMQDSSGGLGGSFGGAGGSGQLLGARGSSDLARWTTRLSILFFVLVLVLGRMGVSQEESSSYKADPNAAKKTAATEEVDDKKDAAPTVTVGDAKPADKEAGESTDKK